MGLRRHKVHVELRYVQRFNCSKHKKALVHPTNSRICRQVTAKQWNADRAYCTQTMADGRYQVQSARSWWLRQCCKPLRTRANNLFANSSRPAFNVHELSQLDCCYHTNTKNLFLCASLREYAISMDLRRSDKHWNCWKRAQLVKDVPLTFWKFEERLQWRIIAGS